MDYLYYILAVLVVGFACLCAVRFATRGRNAELMDYHRNRSAGSRRAPVKAGGRNAQRGQLGPGARVPARSGEARGAGYSAPWGWPSRDARVERAPLSSRLQNITNRLVREKELAGQGSPDARRQRCIRALLEDRYGRVHHDTMAEVEYRKVKAPRLRDPAAPHDQMDNFGTREAERLSRGLQQVRPAGGKPSGTAGRQVRQVDLKNIKQPWGW